MCQVRAVGPSSRGCLVFWGQMWPLLMVLAAGWCLAPCPDWKQESGVVCASDGISYSSLCALQGAGRELRHRGACVRGRRGRCLAVGARLQRVVRLEFSEWRERAGKRVPRRRAGRRAALWKFSLLDSDSSGWLSSRELRPVRKHVPGVCRARLVRVCGGRRGRLRKGQWLRCLGVRGRSRGRIAAASGIPLRASEPRLLEPEGCDHERQLQQENLRLSGGEVFVPECGSSGLFLPVQCLPSSGFCWCAEPHSGRAIPGTSVRHHRPACPPSSRGEPCPQERLLQQLLLLLSRQLSAPHEGVARRKFGRVDVDGSGVWEKQEWQQLSSQLSRSGDEQQDYPLVRRCGPELVASCDQNADGNIALSEWLVCVTESEISPEVAPKPKPTLPKNPFDRYLKSD